jgi:hydrogenase/urease accessory protein HupE
LRISDFEPPRHPPPEDARMLPYLRLLGKMIAHVYRQQLVARSVSNDLLPGGASRICSRRSGLEAGFFSRLTHPLLGADHLLAMPSVGIWGAELGAPAI